MNNSFTFLIINLYNASLVNVVYISFEDKNDKMNFYQGKLGIL